MCKLYSIVISLFIFSSCGPTFSPENRRPVLPPSQDSGREFADNYFLADTLCQESGTPVSPSRFTTHFYIDQEIVQGHSSLSRDGIDLRQMSGAVYEVDYNFHQRTNCSIETGSFVCDDSTTEVLSPPEPLIFCQDDFDYPRYSYEGISLTTTAGVEMARSFYLSIPGHKEDILSARVITLPRIERLVKANSSRRASLDETYVMTDNLGYTPNFRGKPAFIVFPKGASTKQRGLWKDVNLWESPMVLAHEYGHHIFQTHLGSKVASALVLPSKFEGTSGKTFDQQTDSGFRLAAINASSGAIDTAVNEAFSDLFAHQALAYLEGSVWDLDCFTDIRDPEVGVFPGGLRKELSKEYLDMLVGITAAPPQEEGCEYPNFSAVHTMGAIISYGVQSLLNAYHSEASPEQRAAFLLEWLQDLSEVSSFNRSYVNRMSQYILPITKILAPKRGDSNLAAYCESVFDVFPLLKDSVGVAEILDCPA